jgi:release factor glutamine methyltransferase
MPTLRDAMSDAAARLTSAGIERSRFEARLLLGHALGASIEAIIADDQRTLSPQEQASFNALVGRRAAREPMAHIVGWREFYGRRFRVSADVLTPRPDSETLVEAVLEHLADRNAPLRILDLGTGSGCLLLTLLAELPQATGVGIDKSPAALAIAQANAEALGLADRALLRVGDWDEPGWLAALEPPFDLVVANPPYIAAADLAGLDPEVRDHEPRLALDGGPDGLAPYRVLIGSLEHALKPGGLAAFEVGQAQSEIVERLCRDCHLTVLPGRRDLAGIPRCVLVALG